MTTIAKVRLIAILLAVGFTGLLSWRMGLAVQPAQATGQNGTVPPVTELYLPVIRQQAPPPGVETTIYVVQRGDTLFSIARRFGATVSFLVELNGLENPNLIRVGQQLLVPVFPTTATPTPTPTPTPTVAPTVTLTPTVTPVWSDPAAQIELFSPGAGGLYHSPLEVTGFSQTFEGTVNLRLTAGDGTVLAERFTMGGSVDGFDFFRSYLRFTVSEPISATLEVFEISAADGSEIHKVTRPIALLPGQRVIDLNTPAVGDIVCSPIPVNGYSNTFEATVLVALSARDGAALTQSIAMGGNLGFYADFSASLAHPVTAPQPLLVSAYEESAAGLGEIDRTFVPVFLYPPGSDPCP